MTLPATTTERLLAIADHLEANPHLWKQSVWVDGIEDVAAAAGRGICDTPGCIAGEGVMLTPADQLDGITDWHQAGAIALGLTDELAVTLFAGDYQPADLPGVLRAVAGIREGNRTRRAFMLALIAADLAAANLTRANLAAANLTWANLTGANLRAADLAAANLTRANLRGADLRGANLTRANLTGADLYRAKLHGADLTGANLTWANLTRANLTRANLTGAHLTGANLHRADLAGARGDRWTRLPAGWTVQNGYVMKDPS